MTKFVSIRWYKTYTQIVIIERNYIFVHDRYVITIDWYNLHCLAIVSLDHIYSGALISTVIKKQLHNHIQRLVTMCLAIKKWTDKINTLSTILLASDNFITIYIVRKVSTAITVSVI